MQDTEFGYEPELPLKFGEEMVVPDSVMVLRGHTSAESIKVERK